MAKKVRTRLQTTVDEKLLNALKHVAVDKNLKLNDVLEKAIDLYLKSLETEIAAKSKK